ncbi:MAG: hypothetical protein NVSMB9_35050 [Isosphaeraceae bacterium]
MNSLARSLLGPSAFGLILLGLEFGPGSGDDANHSIERPPPGVPARIAQGRGRGAWQRDRGGRLRIVEVFMPRWFLSSAAALLSASVLPGCSGSPEPSKPPAPASTTAQDQGGDVGGWSRVIKPEVVSARRSHNAARVTFDPQSTIMMRDYLLVWVRLTNRSGEVVWYADTVPHEARLTDAQGRSSPQMSVDTIDHGYNRGGVPIAPGQSLEVPFAFQVPSDDAGRLALEIPGENFKSAQVPPTRLRLSFGADQIR